MLACVWVRRLLERSGRAQATGLFGSGSRELGMSVAGHPRINASLVPHLVRPSGLRSAEYYGV